MTILTLPSDKIASNQFGLQSNAAVTRSTFNNRLTTAQRIGSFWTGTYNIAPMKADSDEAKNWQVFVGQLDGSSGRFYGYDPDRRTPSGTASGTPLVNGANQKGFQLVTDGWGTGETVLEKGDYIEFNNEYKMVTADVVSDGSGNATIPIMPEIRQSPPDGEAIVTTNPKGIFMLTESPVWSSNSSRVVDLTINFVETFDYTEFLMTEADDNLVTEAGDRLIL